MGLYFIKNISILYSGYNPGHNILKFSEVVVLRYSVKKVLLKSSEIHRKAPVSSLFFSNVGGLRSATLLEKRPWRSCFSVNIAKFVITPFFIEHLWWLLRNFTTFWCRLDWPQGKHNVQYEKLCVGLDSQNAERHRTSEIGKYQKHLKMALRHSVVPSLPSRNKTQVKVVKNYTKNR